MAPDWCRAVANGGTIDFKRYKYFGHYRHFTPYRHFSHLGHFRHFEIFRYCKNFTHYRQYIHFRNFKHYRRFTHLICYRYFIHFSPPTSGTRCTPPAGIFKCCRPPVPLRHTDVRRYPRPPDTPGGRRIVYHADACAAGCVLARDRIGGGSLVGRRAPVPIAGAQRRLCTSRSCAGSCGPCSKNQTPHYNHHCKLHAIGVILHGDPCT